MMAFAACFLLALACSCRRVVRSRARPRLPPGTPWPSSRDSQHSWRRSSSTRAAEGSGRRQRSGYCPRGRPRPRHAARRHSPQPAYYADEYLRPALRSRRRSSSGKKGNCPSPQQPIAVARVRGGRARGLRFRSRLPLFAIVVVVVVAATGWEAGRSRLLLL